MHDTTDTDNIRRLIDGFRRSLIFSGRTVLTFGVSALDTEANVGRRWRTLFGAINNVVGLPRTQRTRFPDIVLGRPATVELANPSFFAIRA